MRITAIVLVPILTRGPLAVPLSGTQNPRFFEGTAVARAAAKELAREPVRMAAT